MMSAEAIAAGGGIAAGGTVATYRRSIGVLSLGSAAGPIGIAAGIVGGIVVAGVVLSHGIIRGRFSRSRDASKA
jgi:hypothetical protein